MVKAMTMATIRDAEGEGLDVAEHGFAQVVGKAGGGQSAVFAAHEAGVQTDSGQQHHGDAVVQDSLHISGCDAVVYDPRHQPGDRHFHHDLQQHEGRCQDRSLLILLDLR